MTRVVHPVLLRLAVLFLITLPLHGAAIPAWFLSQGQKTGYEDDLFLTAFAAAVDTGKAEKSKLAAQDQALRNLAQRLKVTIDASSRTTDSTAGKATFSSYQSDIKALVSLDLHGVEAYETWFSEKDNRWFALAILDKRQQRRHLETLRVALVGRLDGDLAEVKQLLAKKRFDLLKDALAEFDRDLDDLVQNVAMARELGETSLTEASLTKYYTAKSEVRSDMVVQRVLNTSDLIASLLEAFPWKQTNGKTVVLIPAVYKTTDISGQFFYNLREELADALATPPVNVQVAQPTRDAKPDYVLKGSYFEAGSGWHVVFKLTDVSRQTLVATWDVDLDTAFVASQPFEMVPANLNVATVDRDLQSAIFANPTKTELRVWTNKGDEGLVFEEGEFVDLSVQVNRTGYLTILYHLAGDQRRRMLLKENIPIFPKDLDKPYVFQNLGPVSPPYGSEGFQVFFSSNPAPKYPTATLVIEGFAYEILAEDYDRFLVKTRGLGGVAAGGGKTAGPAVDEFKTDTTLALTTVPSRKK